MKLFLRILACVFVINASFSNAADPEDLIFTDSFEQCDFSRVAPEGAIEWDAGGDGTSWSDELNWKGDILPVNGDDVFILLKGSSTITYDITPDATILGSLDVCELLTITGGTLEITEDSWIRNKFTVSGGTFTSTANLQIISSFEQTGGTINGVGTITVSGDFIWTDGRQVGSGFTIAKSGMTASGSSAGRFLQTRTLTLDGDSTVSGGSIRLWDAATINNNSTLTISNDADIPFYSGAISNFYNSSTVTKNNGPDISEIGANFFNTGTVEVESGELWVGRSNGSASSSGEFLMNVDAILGVNGANDMTASSSITGEGGFTMINSSVGATSIKGAYTATGPLAVKGGTLLFAIPVSITDDVTVSGGTLNFTMASSATANVSVSGGTLTADSTLPITGTLMQSGGFINGVGTITVSGHFTWTDGRQIGSGFTIAKSGMTASGSSTGRFLQSRTLTLDADSTVSGGSIRLWDLATINNNSTLTISNDADIPYYSGTVSNFYNNVSVIKSSGSGVSEIGANFFNTGTVKVDNGELWVGRSNGTASSSGEFLVALGAILGVNGANDMTAGSKITGDGGFTMINSSVGATSIKGTYDADGPLAVKGGALLFEIPVSIADDVTVSGGTLNFTMASSATANVSVSSGTLTADSTLPITGTLKQSGGFINGVGTITVSDHFTWTDGRQTGSGFTIAKSGMTASGSSNGRFLQSRTLTLDADSTVSGGSIRLWDAATINNNSTLTISSDADIPFYSGTVSTLNNNLSIIKSTGAGETIIGADINNLGSITVANGTLKFTRTFSQTAAGTLNVGIASLANFDRYAITNAATLDGTLTINLEGGYMPVNTDSFDILTASSVGGTFATVTGTSIGNGNKFIVSYEAAKVVLDVVPE